MRGALAGRLSRQNFTPKKLLAKLGPSQELIATSIFTSKPNKRLNPSNS